MNELDLATTITDRWMQTRGPLFTDMYELAMAQVYVREGLSERQAQFDYFFRSTPDYGTHQAGFCVSAGLEPFLAWLRGVRIEPSHIDALRAMSSPSGTAVFGDDFLEWLAAPGRFDGIEVRAVGEGRVVHPHVPIVTVTGPLAICQLIETSLLNHFNYPTLIATKAARVVQSARGGRVLEFGMRRGPSTGVNEGIRAALIGGCVSTSNVEAAIALGKQPIGTHAHSLVQAYMALGDGEIGAFRAMAASAPDECILLVDTVDTLGSGVPNAIRVFDELRAAGHEPVGVRLDSGDLAYLAVQTAKLLDDAGYPDVSIVLSSDLDELNIWQILTQIGDDAERLGIDPRPIRTRLVYGVGTRLITSHGSGALNGVYKLVGIENADGEWTPAIKISEDPGKVPLPGLKKVWRLYDRRGAAVVDLIGLADEDPLPDELNVVHHPSRDGVHQVIRRDDIDHIEELLTPVFGDDVAPGPPAKIDELAHRCTIDIDRLDIGVRRLVNPHRYHVSLTDRLHRLRLDLIAQAEA
ncbi:MAG: nicotinate phosphoribosyltransferase [Ilumatobacter sp.]|jgi:nicotinate phosphoribosyltransferase|uniref:nicotinate phosphoribosyltransferase n=1 Tax=Ilumatobacter sp. TaxID=1967498 RepID=UPI00391D9AFD